MAGIAFDAGMKVDTRPHPRGLWTLAATELWDRASFYGMQALLILYMVQYLLLPANADQVIGLSALRSAMAAARGPLSVEGQATQVFALYITTLNFFPLIGGWLGDRLISRRTGVIVGAGLMTAGHLALGFTSTFLIGLLLLVTGAGFLRGNVGPQIRALYDAEDPRAAEAFQIFYVTIAAGAFISPLIIGLVNEHYGFHPAFAMAAAGMLIGLLCYVLRLNTLPPDPPRESRGLRNVTPAPGDKRNIIILSVFLLVPVTFWTAQVQVWNIYNIWVKDHVDRTVLGFSVPIPWLQSLDGLAPMIMAIAAMFYWRRVATGSDLYRRMTVGCFLFGAGMLILAGSQLVAGDGAKIPILLPVAFHIVSNLGWVLFAPTAAAFVAAYAPERWRGTMLGLNALTVSLAGFLSGPLSGIYEQRGPEYFWTLIAFVPIVGSSALLIATPLLQRMLKVP